MKKILKKLINNLFKKSVIICTVESCTGGLLFASLTKIPGSSRVLDRGYITYSNQAKIDLVNVKKITLDKYGSVSANVAKEMASGALKKNQSIKYSIAITGIAGPEGGSLDKPVGLVWISVGNRENKINTVSKKFLFKGSRNQIRKCAVKSGVKMLLKILNS